MKYRISMFQMLFLLTFLFYASIFCNLDSSRYIRFNEYRPIATMISKGGSLGQPKCYPDVYGSKNSIIRILYWVFARW